MGRSRLVAVVAILAILIGGWLGGSAGVIPNGARTVAAADTNVMVSLQQELEGLVAGWAGENAVSVTDLQTGQTISVNGDRPQPAACSIKVFIMMAIAHDIEAGKYTAASVEDLVLSAMGPSNTPPARDLIAIAGGGDVGAGVRRINGIMRGLGAKKSILTHPPGYPWEEYGYAASEGVTENLLVADEVNMMLGKLYRREALSDWATDYVLWSMTLAIPGQQGSLGGPIPDDAQLYHKIGLIYEPLNTWNDVGIVTFERGGDTYAYAISYLGSYGADWLDAYYHGASVSGAAWSLLSDYYASAPRAEQCFPETDQCVRGIFYQYWRDNGGAQQQGLPLTGEFTEIDPKTRQSRTVQYFERARFEYHPENSDPQFQVLLGQLGREQFAAKYPAGRPQGQGRTGTCFPATGYCVSGAFAEYWAANGGVMQQGYPISDEFDEVSKNDGKKYRVQYFERARFEWHPEAAGPNRVQLGLLGREQFEARYPNGAPATARSGPEEIRPLSGAVLRARLLRQIAELDQLRTRLPLGASDNVQLGWAEYDRALDGFLSVRPELRAYLLWYYHSATPGATPGLAYHPDGQVLLDPPFLDGYLAGAGKGEYGR